MKVAVLLLVLIFMLTGCDEAQLQNQVEEKTIDIAEMKAKNEKLAHSVKDLTAYAASLSSKVPGGLKVNEIQKALTARESELAVRESRYEGKLERYHLMVIRLDRAREAFYQEIADKLEAIGRANQVMDSYEDVKDELASANAWFKFLLIVGLVIITAFMWVLLKLLRAVKPKKE